ncbi:MAG: exo-alpha-sialidase [Verrucomicrobiales bacterium]|nr:exo-alpha-sialidase [Verrucomicrobiales bacterium]
MNQIRDRFNRRPTRSFNCTGYNLRLYPVQSLLSALLLACASLTSAAEIHLIEGPRTISMQPEYYHGWPTLTRLKNGELLTVWSGRREGHICPFGTVEMMRSRDDGETWTFPRTLLDGPIDDRDAGILETTDGSLIVTTFTSLAYEDHYLKKGKKTDDTAWMAAHNRLPDDKARKAELGEWALRSTDGGVTWSERIHTIVNSPHGPIQLKDGRLLYAGKELWEEEKRIGVCESKDDGKTWTWLAEIPTREGDAFANYHELHAVECDSGKIIVQIRNHNPQHKGETLQSESTDGGKTWTTPHSIGVWGLPSFLNRLRNGDLLMTYGHRTRTYGVQARVSKDEGENWSEPLLISDDGAGGDLGYPSTVELETEGTFLTVWYEKLKDSPNAVLRSAKWKFAEPALIESITKEVVRSNRDGTGTTWFHPRACVVPGEGILMNLQEIGGSDYFGPVNWSKTTDSGKNWSPPEPVASLGRDPVPEHEGLQAGVCDVTPQYHPKTGTVLALGHVVFYKGPRFSKGDQLPRYPVYAVRKPDGTWSDRKILKWDDPRGSFIYSNNCGQRVVMPNGDIIMAFTFGPESNNRMVAGVRCTFDGETLNIAEVGPPLKNEVGRGLLEPSVTRFRDRFYMTIRAEDDRGYAAVSDDGINYREKTAWSWDDGEPLTMSTTQQNWLTHSEGLFLVYTRKDKSNEKVIRWRAPLWMAQVDPERLCLIRDSEKVVLPLVGDGINQPDDVALMGNFHVTNISPEESWVTTGEWMPRREAKGDQLVARIRWSQPNKLALSQNLKQASQTWKTLEPYFSVPSKFQNDFGNYQSPRGDKKIDWPARRKQIKAEWMERIGKWPPLIEQPEVTILETTRRESFTQYKLQFDWLPDQTTTAYLLVPDGAKQSPAVVTVYYEPETAIGLHNDTKKDRDFALQLTRKGFVTLSLGTTETTNNKTYSLYYPNREKAEMEGLSALSYAAANAWQVLAARPEVDSSRIGITGHSYGGKWALFAGALYEKFAAVAVSDPGIMFNSHPSVNYWEPWYLGWHPTPWRKRGIITEENPAQGVYLQLIEEGRDLHELHSLLAPRPFFVSGGAVDPPEQWKALNHLVTLNSELGFQNRVGMSNRPDHSPTPESNAVLLAFFEHFLGIKD